jgi:hypothetical protein
MSVTAPFIHPTVAELQDAIVATAAKPPGQQLTPTDYPIVPSENGDWANYIDEVDAFNYPAKPGIAVIDQTGNFYAVRAGEYDVTAGIDWVVTRLEELLNPREAVDTVLALDRSGSMNSTPPSGGTDPKIDILQDAVGTFLDVWSVMSVPGDRVGVVDFSGDIGQYVSPTTLDHLVSLSTESGLVKSYVNGLAAGGYTSVGGAVATGLDVLSSSPRRHLILMSDGIQNINPMLADVAGGNIEIRYVNPTNVDEHNLVEWVLGDSGIPDKPGQTLASFGTKIHTIGVGLTSSPWTDLLSDVALQTEATHFETPAPEIDLQNFYVTDLLESFRGATPQLLKHSHGTAIPDRTTAKDTCWLNSTARRMTIVLTWQGNPDKDQLLCALEAPDGTLLEIHGRTKVSERRRVITLPLPPYHQGRLLGHSGRWKLHIMAKIKHTVPYQVFWIVDDHRIHLNFKPFHKVLRVGQLLNLEASLLLDNKPFYTKDIRKAVVNVCAPAIDFKRFFLKYTVSAAKLRSAKKQMQWPGPHTDRAVKWFVLSHDKEAVARCSKTTRQSLLLEKRREDLTGNFTLKLPGNHHFTLMIDALDSSGDRVIRTLTRSIYVRSKV